MIVTFLVHQWKAFWRGRSAGRKLVLQILMGFLICYFLSAFLLLGIFLKTILVKLFPGQDIVRLFGSLILYYFIIELMLRFLFQELPVLAVQPYLGLPIRRRQIAAFLEARSLFHFINLMPIFLFLPFCISDIYPAFGAARGAGFIVAIISLTFFNHFLILFVKRKAGLSGWWMLGVVTAFLLIILSDYLGLLPIRQVSASLLLGLLRHPWLSAISCLLAVLSFANHRVFLVRNLYLEEMAKAEKQRRSSDYSWLRQWGAVGDLVEIELKLLFRNKRTKNIFWAGFLALIYGFSFFRPDHLAQDKFGFMLFGNFMITGVFIVNYSRGAFSWQSNYFDGLLSMNIRIADLIRAKLFLYTTTSTLYFILSTAYGFLDWRILPLGLAAWLYNIGCTTVISIYISTFEYNYIDLGKSAFFNWQGTVGMATYLHVFIVMGFPFLLFFPLSVISPWAGVLAVGGMGLVNLLLRNWWVGVLTRAFQRRRYKMLDGYREH
jgi:hypothetical protein